MSARTIGSLKVPAVGYGAMVLSPGMYEDVDHESAVTTLHHVMEHGALIDTSDSYGHDFHNERLIGECIRRRPTAMAAPVVATKFGLRFPAGATAHDVSLDGARRPIAVNCEPRFLRQYALNSLARLGVERIDLWYPHFPDPQVPITDTVGAMAELVSEGLVAHIGLSNISAEQLRAAAAEHPIAAVQTEWSLWHPIDPDLLRAVDDAGAAVVAWWPLGAGALAGPLRDLPADDLRSSFDRFSPDQAAEHAARHESVRAVATRLGVTPAQLALAWLLHQHPAVVPIPGTRRPARVDENLAADAIRLTTDDVVELTAAGLPRR